VIDSVLVHRVPPNCSCNAFWNAPSRNA